MVCGGEVRVTKERGGEKDKPCRVHFLHFCFITDAFL